MAYLGEIIDGKYEILREIGRGGMSVVYLAMDKRLNKQWAIKEFRKDKDDESRKVALEALLKEANLMKKLDHPTLPRIVDIIDDNSTVYIVMDYIEGESLNKVLDAYGAQPQEAVIEWAKQLSEVLDYLHTRVPPVIYRDMKPANIMLKPDGTIRLIDFGIAREYKEGKAGDTTSIGTRGYAAPEQFGDKGQTDARTDIYSLGVTLYHIVTGKNPAEPPYEIYPIRHWNPNLSSGLEWLIQKCTQLNPKDRYQSCAEVTYVLENLEKFEGAYKSKQKMKINLFIISLAMTLIFAILGSVTLIMGNKDHDEQYTNYMSLGTVEGYESAIDFDENMSDPYLELVNRFRNQVRAILPGECRDEVEAKKLLSNGIIYDKEIMTYFSDSRMEWLKNNDIDKYVRVNYELGRLYWNCYKSNEDEEAGSGSLASANESVKYLKRVIDNAYDDEKHYNLTDNEYNLARYYYLLAYFRINETNMKNSDDGSFEVDETIKRAGVGVIDIDNKKFTNNPYNSYWKVNRDLIKNLAQDEVRDIVKLTTLKIVCKTVNNNLYDFIKSGDSSTLSAEEVENFYNSVVEQYNELFASFADELNTDSDIKDRLSETKTVINDLKKSLIDIYASNDITLEFNEF